MVNDMKILRFSTRINTRQPLSASNLFLFAFVLTLLPEPLAAESWYLSNAAGMALSPAPSRLVALRSEYCLAMSIIEMTDLPEALVPYYKPSYRIDCRTLYKSGVPSRRQWVFRDEKGASKLTAAAALEGTDSVLAFIERSDQDGFLTEERQFSSDAETATLYFYVNKVLVRAETRLTLTNEDNETGENNENGERVTEETVFFIDYYQYNRSAALRSIERVFKSGGVSSLPRMKSLFPPIRPHPELDKGFVKPVAAYASDFLAAALDLSAVAGIVYTTDKRGRVLTETHRDAEGTLIAHLENNWAGDRLVSVDWSSFNAAGDVVERRRTEYEYSQNGDRTLERDFNQSVLERTVRKSGNQEIEELYMNGKVVLRAIWENARKISEERVP
jgi:hypothetical protein